MSQQEEHKCEKCSTELELCPADWPFNPDFWICPQCDSTYIFEFSEQKND